MTERRQDARPVYRVDEGPHDGFAGWPLYNVTAYGIFHGTHTGPGGPVPPTGRSTSADYVYVMQFDGDKIVHMTKIWNAGITLKDLGWS